MPSMLSFHSGGSQGVGAPAVMPTSLQIQYLQALVDALPDGEVNVHLFTGDTVPAVGTVLADFTEASFDGYAAVAVALTTPAVNPEGWAQADVPTAHFGCTGTGTPELVTGYYLTDNTDTNYIQGERFPAGVMMDENGDYIDVDTSLQLLDSSQVP